MRKSVVVVSLFISSICFAQEEPQLKMRPGDNFVASGVMIPKSLFDELQAAERALQKARAELSKEVKLVNKDKEDLKTFKNEMDKQQNELRKFVNKFSKGVSVTKEELNQVKMEVSKLRRDLEFRSAMAATWLDSVVRHLNNLDQRVQRLEEKQWHIGLHGLVNFDWNTDKNDWAQFNMLGISGMFTNPKMLVSLDVSAGLNSLTEQFSWAMGASTEYRLTNSWSLGGSVLLGQDLGDMEGAEMLSGSLGPVLRYMHLGGDWTSFSVSLSPCRIGPQGKKEESFNGKPNWYPNFSGLLTLDYFVL
jgi:hypothetical protein